MKLSARYIPARQLPDKSVSLLDTACARVAIGQSAIPPAVEDARREIEHLEIEIGILDREAATGAGHDERLAEAREARQAAEARLAELEARWEQEQALVDADPRPPRPARDGPRRPEGRRRTATGAGRAEPRRRGAAAPGRARREDRRAAVSSRARSPLMQVCVDGQTIAEVVAGWTGIPVGKMVADEIQTVLKLQRPAGGAGHRPVARPGGDRPAHPDRAGQPDRPATADRRVPAGRPQRRRQDRDRPGPGRHPLRRRAEPDHRSTCRSTRRRTRSAA